MQKKCRVNDLTAIILDRPRHKELMEEVRASGARIHLIGDGDVSAAIATATPNSGVDILRNITITDQMKKQLIRRPLMP